MPSRPYRKFATCGLTLLFLAARAVSNGVPTAQECKIEVPEWAPRGSTKTARPRITATVTSTCEAAIEPSSIRMIVDDKAATPTTDGVGSKVTVAYTPEVALLEESDHTVTIRASDAKGRTGERTWTFHVPDTYTR
jgi:hypothetical protein